MKRAMISVAIFLTVSSVSVAEKDRSPTRGKAESFLSPSQSERLLHSFLPPKITEIPLSLLRCGRSQGPAHLKVAKWEIEGDVKVMVEASLPERLLGLHQNLGVARNSYVFHASTNAVDLDPGEGLEVVNGVPSYEDASIFLKAEFWKLFEGTPGESVKHVISGTFSQGKSNSENFLVALICRLENSTLGKVLVPSGSAEKHLTVGEPSS